MVEGCAKKGSQFVLNPWSNFLQSGGWQLATRNSGLPSSVNSKELWPKRVKDGTGTETFSTLQKPVASIPNFLLIIFLHTIRNRDAVGQFFWYDSGSILSPIRRCSFRAENIRASSEQCRDLIASNQLHRLIVFPIHPPTLSLPYSSFTANSRNLDFSSYIPHLPYPLFSLLRTFQILPSLRPSL